MAHWLLSQEPPAGFSVDRECELKASDDSKGSVRYAHHPLDIQEIQQHIRHGKMPTRLALTRAGRVSFVLTDTLVLKKIKLLGVALEYGPASESPDSFDADTAIMTGELDLLIPDLIDALGGELALTVQDAAL